MSERPRLRVVVGTEEEGVASETAGGSSPVIVSGNVEDGAIKRRAALQGDIWLETSSPEGWSLDRKDVVAAAIIPEERDEDVTPPGHKDPACWPSDTHHMTLFRESREREDLNPRIRHDPRVVVI